MKDLYSILGVDRKADQAAIKSAYRKLAKELHPDRHKDDSAIADRFKEVSAAYAILGDPDKRKRYDRGEIDESGQERAPFAAGAAGGGAGGGGFQGFRGFRQRAGDSGDFGDAEDLFADLFGFGRGRRSRSARGQDVSYRLNVDFMEAVQGTKKRVGLSGGKTLDVRIPAGVRDGQQIRLAGQGEPGAGGGPPGDALVTVAVAPHPLFTREGDDIHMELPITIDEAVLGARVDVPTVHGDVHLTIPKGVSSGKRMRLKGKGVTRGGKSGDQYVTLRIALPETPDPALETAIREWAQSRRYSVRDKLKV